MTVYSKSVFNIISEHEPVSKARFHYIGGEWIGGDIQKTLYTPFRKRNYDEEVDKIICKNKSNDYEPYHLRKYTFGKEDIVFNELFYLNLSKFVNYQGKNKQDLAKK